MPAEETGGFSLQNSQGDLGEKSFGLAANPNASKMTRQSKACYTGPERKAPDDPPWATANSETYSIPTRT